MEPVAALDSLARTFGAGAARRKLAALDAIARARRLPVRDLLTLHDTLCFLRAYPDSPAVLRRVEALAAGLRARGSDAARLRDTGFPGSVQCYSFSYGTLRHLVRLCPGCLEVDWGELEDGSPLHHALVLLVTTGECQGLDDISLTLPEWFARAKPEPAQTDLEFLLALFATSPLRPADRAYVFDSCDLPVRFALLAPGLGRCEMARRPARLHYQTRALARDRTPLARLIRRPPERVRPGGRALFELALKALACRNLEIPPLSDGNPDDVVVGTLARGLEIALVGTVPEQRDPLETSACAFVLKNGVPLAYGPASTSLGCCELGLNIFPEFRGAEVRFVFGQYMRMLHHVLGAEDFFLTTYARGEGNEAALRTGAFWFYRKLGFAALNPEVEALARAEEAKMRAQPGYRSDRRTLRRLSHTEGSFDLSGGACPRPDFGALGLRQTQMVAGDFGGDRARAERAWVARAARALGLEDLRAWSAAERRALRILAPVLGMIPDLAAWGRREKERVVRLVRLKGARFGLGWDRALCAHRRLAQALRALARDG
ncbi:MAG: hypothetical protein ACYTED_18920 [Planctomycetota bacterium]|jgi:hypothetical protein